MSTPNLELTGALYRYPRSGFSLWCETLCLYPGEVSLIVGSNGSGKTTLSKMLCGILPLNEGVLRVGGVDATGKSRGFIGRTAGYLFQSPEKQLFATSVWEELTFVPLLLGRDEQETSDRAMALLLRFGLLHAKQRSPYRLSRGEKQRLALCAILMQEVRHLLLDEPTTGLDSQSREVFHDMMADLLNRSIGITVITHDNEFMRRYPARIIKVREGVVDA